ncbi:hypothetical protein K8I61_07300 [bacterium]|nr:hypothetical protein [bacterium]
MFTNTFFRSIFLFAVLFAFAVHSGCGCGDDDDNDDDSSSDDDGDGGDDDDGDDDAGECVSCVDDDDDPDGGGGGCLEDRYLCYIRSDTFTRLVIEVDYVPGLAPRDGVAADLAARFASILDKPDGIEVVLDEELPPMGADHVWTSDALHDFADEHFNLDVPDGTVAMHAMFVDGELETDGSARILGLAWSHAHIAIFRDTIDDVCGGGVVIPSLEEELCRRAELTIWTHEVGHVIGLVNNGVPMVNAHEDTEHAHHDVDDECVMYWAHENDTVIDVIAGNLIGDGDALAFDDACLADVAAVKTK